MKEFNLERALAGEPVVTRNGKKVTELHLFKNEALIQPLYGTIEGDEDVLQWTTYGIYNIKEETSWDLFMAEQKKSIWVNVFEGILSGQLCTSDHDSLNQAIENKLSINGFTYLKTIEITNEP
jgi:hypothetical protein